MVNRRRFLNVLAVSFIVFAACFVFRHGVHSMFAITDTTIREIDREPQLFNNGRVRLRGDVVDMGYKGVKYVLKDWGRGAVLVHQYAIESGEGQVYVQKRLLETEIGLSRSVAIEPHGSFVWTNEGNVPDHYVRTRDVKVAVIGIVHYYGLAMDAAPFYLEVERIEPAN